MSRTVIHLPAVALRGMTILPGMVAHFDISRDRSIHAIEEAMVGDQKIFLITQQDASVEEPARDDLYQIGVIAEVKQVLPGDFIKFGLIPEFIGRVPVNVSLEQLDKEALIRILKEPKNSLIKQYKKLFEIDGVELEFEDDAVEAIAEKSLARKTGARGLRAIMEDTMMDLMYQIPSDESIVKCTITKETVEDKKAEIEYHNA